MKKCIIPFIALLFIVGCKKDRLQPEDLESTLPGRWEIESININSLYLETVFMGDTIQEGQNLNDIGFVEFPEFEVDSLLLNSGSSLNLPFTVEIDLELFNFEIDYLSTGSENHFGAFRISENNDLSSEYGQFLETTLLFTLNSNITILDQNSIMIEPANGDHVINLKRE